jgi:preprotein translocase subunit SecF
MPIYRAKTKCFVGQSMREADEEFEYNGEFNSNIELVGGTEPDLPVSSNTTTVSSEDVQPTTQSIDYESMTKAELEVYGRSVGVELDRRQTKDILISQLVEAAK